MLSSPNSPIIRPDRGGPSTSAPSSGWVCAARLPHLLRVDLKIEYSPQQLSLLSAQILPLDGLTGTVTKVFAARAASSRVQEKHFVGIGLGLDQRMERREQGE